MTGHPSPADTVLPADPPSTRRDAGSWLMIALFGLLAGEILGSLVVAVVAAILHHSSNLGALESQSVPPAWVVASGLVGLWAGFLSAIVVASRTRGTGRIDRDLGLRFRPIDLLIGPIVGFGGQYLLLPLLYLPFRPVVHNLDQRLSAPAKSLTGGFQGADIAVVGALTVLVVPLVEEMFFRGLVFRSLDRLFEGTGPRMGPTLAVVLTGIIFGLAHFEALQLPGLAVFGMVLAILVRRTRRLGPSIIAHACFNLAAVISVAAVPGFHPFP